jgi:hypothetical protein
VSTRINHVVNDDEERLQSFLVRCYVCPMARKNDDLNALRDMISEAHDILRSVVLPEERSQRAYELLAASLQLADHLLEVSPAATLGARGGIKTAKRGPDYFRKIAAMRKNKKGGRPKTD